MPALLSPFWAPISGLIEVMSDPSGIPVLGYLGWIGVLATAGGLLLCVLRRDAKPLFVLLALLPVYFVIVCFFAATRSFLHMYYVEYLVLSVAAAVIALGLMAVGFVRSRGSRLAAGLMLPMNGAFLIGLLIVTEVAAGA